MRVLTIGAGGVGGAVAAIARRRYLYHVADNEQTMREDGAQAVVWQTAINPLVALELIHEASGAGRASWARRPSTPPRSWTCWPTTARPTG